jgi:Flp pilus assembly protein TadG
MKSFHPHRLPEHGSRSARPRGRAHSTAARRGKVLVLLAIILPSLIGFAGLVIDASLLSVEQRNLQHVADAGATAAAMALFKGQTVDEAKAAAVASVQTDNNMSAVDVEVHIPPSSGPFSSSSAYAEVIAKSTLSTYMIQIVGAASSNTIKARSVAGSEGSTSGGAVVVLDPDPQGTAIDLSPLASLSLSLPPLQLGGLEVLGAGTLRVNGAVLVNNQWGGVDEQGNPAGQDAGPPYAVACTPLVGLTKLTAQDIRVVGGVDNPQYYGHVTAGRKSPLLCGKLPVNDPLAGLPAPTVSVDPANVVATNRGGVQVATLPLAPVTTLNPGVYDWINIVSGRVTMNPGVYIVRSVNPATQISLSILGGTVTANNVMFYITDSNGYSAALGAPDSADGNAAAPVGSLGTLLPSVVITSIAGSSITAINNAASPYNGVLIYQRRLDRRPIVLVDQQLLLGGTLRGAVYGKYASALFAAQGTYDMRFVVGSMRFANLLSCTLSPTRLFPPAQDVFLVE